jgi:hypothetical protein
MDIDRCGVARWCPSFGAGPTDEATARRLVKDGTGFMTGARMAGPWALSEMVQASDSRRASMVATTANSGAGALGPLMPGCSPSTCSQPTVLVF